MKKIGLLISVFVASSLSAMYQSNPLTPELIDKGLFLPQDFALGIKLGYQFDRIFNRYLSISNVSGYVHNAKILMNQGVLVLNFFDSVEIWGSSGAANFQISDKIQLPSGKYQEIRPSSHSQWIWGTGMRASFFTWGNTTLGASAGYQSSHPKHFRYWEWQLGLGIAQKIGDFIPYIGGTFSRAKARLTHIAEGTLLLYPDVTTIRMHNKRPGGLTLGCNYCTGKIADLGLEFRAFSELGLTAKADFKF